MLKSEIFFNPEFPNPKKYKHSARGTRLKKEFEKIKSLKFLKLNLKHLESNFFGLKTSKYAE